MIQTTFAGGISPFAKKPVVIKRVILTKDAPVTAIRDVILAHINAVGKASVSEAKRLTNASAYQTRSVLQKLVDDGELLVSISLKHGGLRNIYWKKGTPDVKDDVTMPDLITAFLLKNPKSTRKEIYMGVPGTGPVSAITDMRSRGLIDSVGSGHNRRYFVVPAK